ncbi:energy-coupling factor transporter ATPase [Erysipelothrix urinaevulpis]|uniref:energy-coupling factor transporter ATPase n=1 Tax=Erysipelothrix urinaevulpis TaxID=2683717 RepID=UPI00135A9EBF|nr:energy-coupling factor transporter ATPase [Erysipelothrix urinaevulpis]
MGIQFEEVSYEYSPNTPFAHHALKNINCEINLGKLTAIVGETGSGKSTLVQHLNALLQPTSGKVTILGQEVVAKQKAKGLKALRAKVGLVFQFPEMQLFEETIYKDVSFGPSNFGFSETELKQNVEEALKMVGIDESLWDRSPLNLSGGQKRRVAIAGVLASNPEVIVLDEPTAGLDPQGSKDMMQLFLDLKNKHQKTVIMVTHDLDHVLNYADDVLQLEKGEIIFSGSSDDFFQQLEESTFVLPKTLQLKKMLAEKGFDTTGAIDVEEIATCVKEGLR